VRCVFANAQPHRPTVGLHLPPELPQSCRTVARRKFSSLVERAAGWWNVIFWRKVFGWNTLEVLAFKCGNPEAPAHAIPPEAWARLHIRFTVDADPTTFEAALRRRLDECGFPQIELIPLRGGYFAATRLDPDNPWARFAIDSLQKTSGKKPAVLPNIGGSLPNDAFTDVLGLSTVWIPHSYGGCSQHAPDEHVLAPLMRDALRLMTGLFHDLAEQGAPEREG
jgi:acetylornithine deacetylase/succinyl-diaminopimelate desuccinylase-like protein